MGSNGKAAFDAEYRMYYNSVYRAALKRTRNRHTSEDITHDVFLKYYLYTQSGEAKSPQAWLHTVCSRAAQNHIKKHSKEMLSFLDGEKTELVSCAVDPEYILLEKLWEYEVRESAGIVLNALRRKNPNWYAAVIYVYALSKERKEAAALMGISVNALDGLLKRAKKWIKQNYRNEYDLINSK